MTLTDHFVEIPKGALRIAPNLVLPLSFVTGTHAILGIKGSGKTHTASVHAEELLEAGQQIVVIDPTGAWWGLRSSKDGESPGYYVVVMGGRHGDMPLAASAGNQVARAVFETSVSLVLDLSEMNKTELATFVGGFLEELYRLMDGSKVLHVFADEAHVYAPQGARGEKTRSMGAMESVVGRGRIKGIGITMITQRPQKLNKDVLTQAGSLTVHRLNHNLDIDAVRDWVESTGASAISWKGLPSQARGDAWYIDPFAGLCVAITVRDRKTFDSSKTPEPGVAVATPKKLRAVDIEQLRLMMGPPGSDTITEGPDFGKKALSARSGSDGVVLREKIKQLEAELEALKVDATARANSARSAAKAALGLLSDSTAALQGLVRAMTLLADAPPKRKSAKVAAASITVSGTKPMSARTVAAVLDVKAAAERVARSVPKPGKDWASKLAGEAVAALETDDELTEADLDTEGRAGAPEMERREGLGLSPITGFSPCEQAILDVLARQKGPRSRKQVAIEAGYSHKSGSYGAAVSRLLKDGLIWEQHAGLTIADKGKPLAQKRSKGSLLDYWNSKLGLCERAVVATLRHEGVPIAAATLAAMTNYSRTSGSYGAALAKLRDLGLISGRDPIELCKELR